LLGFINITVENWFLISLRFSVFKVIFSVFKTELPKAYYVDKITVVLGEIEFIHDEVLKKIFIK